MVCFAKLDNQYREEGPVLVFLKCWVWDVHMAWRWRHSADRWTHSIVALVIIFILMSTVTCFGSTVHWPLGIQIHQTHIWTSWTQSDGREGMQICAMMSKSRTTGTQKRSLSMPWEGRGQGVKKGFFWKRTASASSEGQDLDLKHECSLRN